MLESYRIKHPEYEISDLTLISTDKIVTKLYHIAKQYKLWWFPPLVSGDYYSLNLYWNHNGRRYDIFIEEEDVSYIAYWGWKTDQERHHGRINNETDLYNFWNWIADTKSINYYESW